MTRALASGFPQGRLRHHVRALAELCAELARLMDAKEEIPDPVAAFGFDRYIDAYRRASRAAAPTPPE